MAIDEKLKKLQDLMHLTNEGLTRQEFVEAFQKVIDYAKKIKDGNEHEWTLIRAAFSMLEDKLTKDKSITGAKKQLEDALNKLIKEHEERGKKIDEKLAAVKDGYTPQKGKDYRDGKDADEERVVKKVLSRIPKPKDGYTPVKGVDYWDGKDGKDVPHSSAAPHPMRVYDLSAKTDGITKIFTVPKGVAGILHMSDFPYVLCEGNGYTINAARTQITLTVANAPSTNSQLIYTYASQFNILT